MTQQLWEAMTEEAQTAHCLAEVRAWLAESIPTLTGGGATVVTGGSHIHLLEETTS